MYLIECIMLSLYRKFELMEIIKPLANLDMLSKLDPIVIELFRPKTCCYLIWRLSIDLWLPQVS